jgi:very-short-patch-repair endonuclease
MAAILFVGEESAVSHTTAAWKLGFEGYLPDPVHVSTRRSRRPNGLPIKIHQVKVPRDEMVVVSGITITTVHRTLIDLASIGHPRVEKSLDEALRRRMTTLGDLWAMVDDTRRRGRSGVRRLKTLLVERTPEFALTDSDLEVLALRLLRKAGLPEPRCQFSINLPSGPIRIDLAYPEHRLGIELDGYAWHQGRGSFENDRRRDLELGLLGWRVLRFTKPMLEYRPDFFTSTVAAHLDGERRP